MSASARPLLELEDLVVHYPIHSGLLQRQTGCVRAVDHVSLTLSPGETLGLVGESGCGKSTLGRAVVGLVRPTSGTIRIDGADRTLLDRRSLRQMRRQVQIVFQDPVGSLNPRFRIRDIILEGRRIQHVRDGKPDSAVVRDILHKVGLTEDLADRFPHELSGGQRQRVGIARTLVLGPRLIVADEPVSALDVSVQSQVLNLFAELQREFGLTYLFVAHNLAVVAYIADRIAVMYLGKIVELGPSEQVISRPLHPYTVALLSAVPDVSGGFRSNRLKLAGEIPSAIAPPSGCRFRTRCPIAQDICVREEPPLVSHAIAHRAACHFAGAFSQPPAAPQHHATERTAP
ncbi:MAG TPA: oligopeptide/dipeptide ABC transporter ATP-binding protein [Acetobacteraceae bacterium]